MGEHSTFLIDTENGLISWKLGDVTWQELYSSRKKVSMKHIVRRAIYAMAGVIGPINLN